MKKSLFAFKGSFEFRSRLNQLIREFFSTRSYIEVETPILIANPALELHIDAVQAGKYFLRTSPELHMKRLLADGFERIFQIGNCFRANEYGRLHNTEFTMLEWYRIKANYFDVLQETQALIVFLAERLLGTRSFKMASGEMVSLDGNWYIFSISEVFKKYAGWDPIEDYFPSASFRFDEDLVAKVEPKLPKDKPVVLYDYPYWQAAFAKLKDDNKRAERWELYIGGIELANAFSELCDYDEQKKRFQECAEARRQEGRVVYQMDQNFLDSLKRGLPQCAGVALGIDRLLMLFLGTDTLDDILPFRDEL